jgi:hypothetical protein
VERNSNMQSPSHYRLAISSKYSLLPIFFAQSNTYTRLGSDSPWGLTTVESVGEPRGIATSKHLRKVVEGNRTLSCAG